MKRLVLVGAGHAHAEVLRRWIASPLAHVELLLISPTSRAPYSGMVPGWLAGHYRYDEICIDFAALAAAAKARLILDELVDLDPDRRRITLASGTHLAYDVLSLNVGSTLTPPTVAGTSILPLRPLAALKKTWEDTFEAVNNAPSDRPFAITAIGGGAAGFESLLAAVRRLRAAAPSSKVSASILAQSPTLLPGLAPGAIDRAHRVLQREGIGVQLSTTYDDKVAPSNDLLLWATGAQALGWQRTCGLAVSDRGFIQIDRQLRSRSHVNVFAVGDCAEWRDPLPKAGVYAVRMGPVLWRNLRAALGAGRPIDFEPQPRILVLLSTGNRYAIASWGRWSAEGAWVWRWKNWIDRRFLKRFAIHERDRSTRPIASIHEDSV